MLWRGKGSTSLLKKRQNDETQEWGADRRGDPTSDPASVHHLERPKQSVHLYSILSQSPQKLFNSQPPQNFEQHENPYMLLALGWVMTKQIITGLRRLYINWCHPSPQSKDVAPQVDIVTICA